MDVILLAVDFFNLTLVIRCPLAYSGVDRFSLFQSEHWMPNEPSHKRFDRSNHWKMAGFILGSQNRSWTLHCLAMRMFVS